MELQMLCKTNKILHKLNTKITSQASAMQPPPGRNADTNSTQQHGIKLQDFSRRNYWRMLVPRQTVHLASLLV